MAVDSAEVQQEKTDYIRRLLKRGFSVAKIRRMITDDHRFISTPNADTIKKIKDPNFTISVRGQSRAGVGMDEQTLLSYLSDEVQKQYKIGNLTFKEMQRKAYDARTWRLTLEAVDAFFDGTATPKQEKIALKRFEENKTKTAKARLKTQLKNQSGESLAAQYSNLTTRNPLRAVLAMRKGREFKRDIEDLSYNDSLKMGRDWVNNLTEAERNRSLSQLARSTEYSESKVLEQLGREFPELADITVFHHWKGIKEGGGEESVTAIPQSFHRWVHGKQGPLGDPGRSRHDRLNELLERRGIMNYNPYRTRTSPTGETFSGTPPWLRAALEGVGLGDVTDKLYEISTEPASPEFISQQQSMLRHPSLDASATALEQIRRAGMQTPRQNIFSPGSEAYRNLSILDAPKDVQNRRFKGGRGIPFNPKLFNTQGQFLPTGSIIGRQLKKRLR